MKGKIIVIEGTDCSGKQTQSEILVKKLNNDGVKSIRLSFPMYDTPTGKIIAGPYLGKVDFCEGFFEEGASNVHPKVASMYYCADRLYNIDEVVSKVNQGYVVVLDRYVESNMAHQSAKFDEASKQDEMIDWIDSLEYGFLKFPRPDKTIFLHLPTNLTQKLKEKRGENADQHENNFDYLSKVEKIYFGLAQKYNFEIVECSQGNQINSIEQISEEIYNIVKKIIER